MRPLKILMTNAHSGAQTGSGMQLYLLARELVKRGHTVTAAFKKKPGDHGPHRTLAKPRDAGVGLVRVPFAKLKYSFTIPALLETGKYLRAEDFDLVHSFSGMDLNYMFILSWFGPMTLVSNRGTGARLDIFNSIKYRSSHVARIVANSEAVKRVLGESGGVAPAKIEVIYSAADLTDFDPGLDGGPVRAELGLPAGAPVVGVVGSLRFEPGHLKGGMELLAAAPAIIAAYPEVRFLIVGSVSQEIFRRVADPAVAGHFIFAGFRDDIPRVMAACEMIVSPSIKLESLAGVLREALAMKRPVVATDLPGNNELVIPDRTGLLVPPSDPEALARAVIALLQDPARSAAMAAAGRRLVEEQFSLTARVALVEKLYYQALETRGPGRLDRPRAPRPEYAVTRFKYLSFDFPGR